MPNMKEHKLFVHRIGLVAITKFINNFRSILLLPILTKNLPIEAYGIWVQLMVTIGLVPSLMTLGLSSAMVRFIPSIETKEKRQDIFYSIILVVSFTGMVTAFLIYAISEPISWLLFDGNVLVAKILAFIILFEVIERILFKYFQATQQIKKHSFLILSKNICLIFLVTIFVLKDGSIVGTIVALAINYIIIFFISTILIISDLGLKLPKFTNLKEYLVFSIPLVPGGMSAWVANSSDRYVIGGFLGTSAVGYYSPGYALGNIVRMFVEPLNFMLPMVLSKYYDVYDIEKVRRILRYSLKYYLAISIPAVFGLSFLSKPMLKALSTAEIADQSYLVTPLVALSAFFFGMYHLFQKVAMLVKKTKPIGIAWIVVAVLNLILNILLVPDFGIIAAAFTTLVSFGIILAFIINFSYRFLRFDIDYKFIVKSLFSSVLMSGIILFLNPQNTFSIIFTVIVCFIFYFVILLSLRGFDKQEIDFFKKIFVS